MDALVHHRAAAVEGERAAPGGGIIIGLRAPPRDEGACHGQLAETAGFEGGFQCDRAGAEATGKMPATVTPAFAQAAVSSSQRARVTSRGFSTTTCLPALAQARAGAR
jgi:hypothetical protein